MNMFILDLPEIPDAYLSILVAEYRPVAVGATNAKTMTIGVCRPVENHQWRKPEALSPAVSTVNYLWEFQGFRQMPGKQGRETLYALEKTAKITILQQPSHGKLTLTTDEYPNSLPNTYFYHPEPGFLGKDRIVAWVEMGQYKIKLVYSLYPVDHGVGPETEAKVCGKRGTYYRIVQISPNA